VLLQLHCENVSLKGIFCGFSAGMKLNGGIRDKVEGTIMLQGIVL
jgi:hypothetical protein